jgi:hypothetical protein
MGVMADNTDAERVELREIWVRWACRDLEKSLVAANTALEAVKRKPHEIPYKFVDDVRKARSAVTEAERVLAAAMVAKGEEFDASVPVGA